MADVFAEILAASAKVSSDFQETARKSSAAISRIGGDRVFRCTGIENTRYVDFGEGLATWTILNRA